MARWKLSENLRSWTHFIGYGLLAWIGFFVIAPSFLVILYSLQGETRHPGEIFYFHLSALSFTHYANIMEKKFFIALLQSVGLSAAAAFGCLALAYPFVWIVTRRQPVQQAKLLFFALIPFFTNSLVKLYGLRLGLHLQGPLNQFVIRLGLVAQPVRFLYSYWVVILGLVELCMVFMIFPLWLGFNRIPKSLMEASEDLGANEWQRFRHVTFPLTMPAICNGWFMVFFPAMGSFYVSDLLGGSKQILAGNLIKTYGLILQNWQKTCALSLVIVLLMGSMFWLKVAIERWFTTESAALF